MRYVVQVEIDRRVLYGPFDTIDEATAAANRFRDEHVAGVLDISMFVNVKELHDVPWLNDAAIHPNQTTLQDHIDDLQDHIDDIADAMT